MYFEDLLETTVNQESFFKLLDAPPTFDKRPEKYRIPFNDYETDGKYYKYVTIKNFGTGLHGSRIRNAVTG